MLVATIDIGDTIIVINQKTRQALLAIHRKEMCEIRAYGRPPKDLETVMAAVMIALNKPTDWMAVRKQMSDPNFLK